MNMTELRTHGFDTATKTSIFVGNNNEPEQNWYALVNDKTGKTAAFVSDGYNPVQHATMANAAAEALNNLNIAASARVGDSGNKVFIDITFDQAKLYVKVGEEFIAGIRLVNSYDKTTGIMVLPFLKRLACSNGMVVNVGWVHELNIRHTTKMTQDFETTIQVMLNSMIQNNEKLKALVNDCISDSAEWELLDRIIAGLVQGREKHLEKIKALLKEAVGDKPATRWDVYNAFTSYATHGAQIRPTVEAWLQNKAQKLLVTPLARLVPEEKLE